MATLNVRKIEPHEWATFHLKIRLQEADYDYEEGSYTGHGDRLVLEYFDKVSDKHPVERLYFDLDGNEPDAYAEDGIEELLETIAWDIEQGEV